MSMFEIDPDEKWMVFIDFLILWTRPLGLDLKNVTRKRTGIDKSADVEGHQW